MQPIRTMNLALALLLPILAIVSTGETDTYYYYYYKEKISLTAETRSIAVYDLSQSELHGNLTNLFAGAGLTTPDYREIPVPGWSIALLETASGTPIISGVGPVISRLIGIDQHRRYFLSPVFGNGSGEIAFMTPNILVRFEKGISESTIRHILDQTGAERQAEDMPFGGMDNCYRIATEFRNGLKVLETANRLAEVPEVIYSEPEMIMTGRAPLLPNDELFPASWGLHNTGQPQFPGAVVDMDIDAPEAWAETIGDPSIIVVIIDSGVQQDHPDINQIPGTDTSLQPSQNGDGGPANECDNHGTIVAGVVSGIINNSIGIAGVAPNVKVASARAVISAVGSCSGSVFVHPPSIVDAVQWAEDIGARITNNSYTVAFPTSSLTEKFQETYENGMLHFAGAGNNPDPETPIPAPANLASVNAVSSIDANGQISSFSSFGPEIAFAAPGSQIWTTDRTGALGRSPGDYVLADGTSIASPMAAGVAALILSRTPGLAPPQVEDILRATALDLGVPGKDEFYGWGLVNAGGAASFDEIFSSDFESGDTSDWSSTQN